MQTFTRTVMLAAAFMLAACGGGEEKATQAPPTTVQVKRPPVPTVPADDTEADPLSIFLDADVIEGKAPLTIHFDVDVDGGTPPFKWKWDYGDGNSSTAAEAKHTYTYEKPGVFMVELEVEDSLGDSDFDILEIEVFEK